MLILNRQWLRLAIFVASLSFQIQTAFADECTLRQVDSLEMIETKNGSILVPAKINGQPTDLILDTGAVWSVLRQGVIGDLRARGGVVPMIGAGGTDIDHAVRVASLELGSLTFKDIDFYLGPDAMTTDERVGGNLAVNILRSFDVEIDFGKRRVFLFSKKHCEGRVVHWPHNDLVTLPLNIDENGIMSMPMIIDGKSVHTLIDTGASMSVLSLRAADRLFDMNPQSPGVESFSEALTLDGPKLPLFRRQFDSLAAGDITFIHPWLTLGEDRIWRALRGSGYKSYDLVLGLHQLRKLHLYFAYDENKVYLTTVAGDAAAADNAGAPVLGK